MSRNLSDSSTQSILLQLTSAMGDLNISASDFIDIEIKPAALKEKLGNPSVETLLTLKCKITEAPKDWLKEFKHVKGVTAFFDSLAYIIFVLEKRTTNSSGIKIGNRQPSSIPKDAIEIQKISLCVQCFVEGINRNYFSIRDLKENPDAIRNLVKTIEYTPDRSKLLTLLAAMSILSDDHNDLVVDAIKYFKTTKLGVFRQVVHEVKDGDDLIFKTAFITFVNSLLVKLEKIDDRVKMRGIFVTEGFDKVFLDTLVNDYPDPELQEQIKIFNDELKSDLEEAGCTEEQDSVDPFAVIYSLWDNMQGTGLEETFISTLNDLFCIGLPKNADTIWKYVKQIVHYLSDIIHSTDNISSVEDIVVRLLSRCQVGSVPSLRGSQSLKRALTGRDLSQFRKPKSKPKPKEEDSEGNVKKNPKIYKNILNFITIFNYDHIFFFFFFNF